MTYTVNQYLENLYIKQNKLNKENLEELINSDFSRVLYDLRSGNNDNVHLITDQTIDIKELKLTKNNTMNSDIEEDRFFMLDKKSFSDLYNKSNPVKTILKTINEDSELSKNFNKKCKKYAMEDGLKINKE